MAQDNEDLSITPPLGTKLNLPKGTLQGETAAIQTMRLVNMTGGDGAHAFADVTLPPALGAGGGMPVTIVGDSIGSAVEPTDNTAIVSMNTKTLVNGIVPLVPKFAKIVASASGVTNLIALVAAKKLRVLGYVLVANAPVNVKFQSHVTPTDLTGLLYLAANTGVAAAFCPLGLFETIAGEALDLNLSGAVAVGGHLLYVEI